MFTRSAWLVIVAPLFCLGCEPPEPPDARHAQFVGTWKEIYQGPKGIVTLKEDGTYTATVPTPPEQRVLFHLPETYDMKGTWRTTKGEIHFHVDEATAMNDELAGRDATESIVNVNENWFSTTDARNHEIMYKRWDEAQEAAEKAKEAALQRGP